MGLMERGFKIFFTIKMASSSTGSFDARAQVLGRKEDLFSRYCVQQGDVQRGLVLKVLCIAGDTQRGLVLKVLCIAGEYLERIRSQGTLYSRRIPREDWFSRYCVQQEDAQRRLFLKVLCIAGGYLERIGSQGTLHSRGIPRDDWFSRYCAQQGETQR